MQNKLFVCRYADLDGTNRQVVVTAVSYAFAVEVFRGSVYWCDWDRRTIERADITTDHTGNRTVLIKTMELPSDLHVYHPDRQPLS